MQPFGNSRRNRQVCETVKPLLSVEYRMQQTNTEEMEWSTQGNGKMEVRRKQLGEATDGDKLGSSLYELPAGKRSWPYHYHTANEEAIYVLAGTGTLRADGTMHKLQEGDYVTFPADASGAHRIINNSEETLRYLMISTMNEPEITIYPDSEKFGVYVGSPPGGRQERSLEGYYEQDGSVDYWNGEDDN